MYESVRTLRGDRKPTNVVRVVPLEPNLQIVVLVNQVQKPVQQLGTLLLGQTVDVPDVPTDGEDALPTRHRVRPHDRVNGLELGADILWRASWLVVELEARCLGDLLKARLLKRGRQGLEELLVWFADTVVDLIA